MRIVGGTWRGRSIEAPEGRTTRPTTDRMRETIASMVLSAQGLDLSNCAVLDAFAGSGGVGLEMLSRGASHCTFCERDRRTASIVRRNCRTLGAPPKSWDVVCGDVFRLAQMGFARERFSVVFLDPPYAMPETQVQQLVETLGQKDRLAPGCLVAYERSSKGAPMVPAGFEPLRSRTHGTTTIDLLRWGGTDG